MNVLVLYYSMYGHIFKMAEAAAQGVEQVQGARAIIRQTPETLSEEILGKMGALETRKSQDHIKICTLDDVENADAIIFGTPTRYGNMCGQMRQFIDSFGQLWLKDAFVGKVGSVFTSSNNQHGGQESTILSFHFNLFHLGMIIVGLPYTFKGQMGIDEIKGGSPYGASTIAGGKGERTPSEADLNGARFQGKHVAQIAAKLIA